MKANKPGPSKPLPDKKPPNETLMSITLNGKFDVSGFKGGQIIVTAQTDLTELKAFTAIIAKQGQMPKEDIDRIIGGAKVLVLQLTNEMMRVARPRHRPRTKAAKQ